MLIFLFVSNSGDTSQVSFEICCKDTAIFSNNQIFWRKKVKMGVKMVFIIEKLWVKIMKKILYILAFIFFGLFGIVNEGWSSNVTLAISDYAASNGWVNGTKYTSVTLDSYVTATASGGAHTGKYYTTDESWRFYANETGTLTLSTTSETISSIIIIFTTKDNGKMTYNGSSLTSGTAKSVSGSSISLIAGSTSGSNGKVFITSISVTYSSGISYTITAQSNNTDYGSVSLSDKIITASPNSGYTYASPAYTVVSGTATVTQGTGVNVNKFTVSPASNCTIRINFKRLPTIHLNINDNEYSSVIQSEYGEEIDLTDSIPNISRECELNRWEFVGWINTNDKDNRNLITTITPTKDTTLYALFKILEEGGENVVDTLTYDNIGLGWTQSSETYTNFSNFSSNSNALYSGQICAFRTNQTSNHFIQMRATNPSGIVSKESGGSLNKIKIKWNSTTAEGRKLLIYTSDTSLISANLYTYKTPYDTISYPSNAEILLDSKQYIGIRSDKSALYIDTIYITWTTASYEYSINPKCYETNISVAEWFEDSVKFDIGDYESIYKYDGMTNPFNSCDSIRIKITNTNSEECIRWFQVPIFGGAHTPIDNSTCDVVILGDSTLTITSTTKSSNVYVYPGGKLLVGTPSGIAKDTLKVNSLTLRRDNDSIPQLMLYNDGFIDVKNKMFFEMRTDGEDWRWLTLPDTFRTSLVNEPEEVVVKYYDGAIRAENGRGGWKEEWDGTKNYTKKFAPGEGCIFGITENEKRIYKIELDTNILSLEKASGNKHIKVENFYKPGKPKNDLGWNLVGNPFLTTYNVNEEFGSIFNASDSLVEEIINNQWTGRWDTIDNTTRLRYIVVPSDKKDQHIIDAGGYEQICLRNGYRLKPFTSFFIQAKNNGELIFFHGQRIANAPLRNHQNINKETFLQIQIGSLKTGCYISNKFNDDYEIGDDMESLYQTYQLINGYKLLYSAINDSIINAGVHVYTHCGVLSLDEKTDLSEFEEINALYNGNWYDLLHGETVDVSGEFILQAKRKQHNVATGIDETTVGCDIQKFIYDGKIFIKKNNRIFTVLGEIVK